MKSANESGVTANVEGILQRVAVAWQKVFPGMKERNHSGMTFGPLSIARLVAPPLLLG